MIYVMSGGKTENLDEELSTQEAVITDLDQAIEVFLASEPEVDDGLPKFTYSGNYTLLDDGEAEDGTKNWRIKFYDSGTLTFTKAPGTIDVFLVGGGAGGGTTTSYFGGGGGGGGYTLTESSVIAEARAYEIVVGAGGAAGTAGGNSQAFNLTANGGESGTSGKGGKGGSGGGAAGSNTNTAGAGGSNGSNGENNSQSNGTAGAGQGTTTREFGEESGDLYSGGGGGGAGYTGSSGGYGNVGGEGGGGKGANNGGTQAGNGVANTGGGGGGRAHNPGTSVSGSGGSGIIIIRNHREVAA